MRGQVTEERTNDAGTMRLHYAGGWVRLSLPQTSHPIRLTIVLERASTRLLARSERACPAQPALREAALGRRGSTQGALVARPRARHRPPGPQQGSEAATLAAAKSWNVCLLYDKEGWAYAWGYR